MGFKADDAVVVPLVSLGLLGGLVAQYLKFPPILVAVLLALGVASAIYRFLGGVAGASIATGSMRLGGTAAVFLAIAWFVNNNLVEQIEIEPNPATWLALDHREGLPVAVSFGGVDRVAIPESDLMDQHSWSAKLEPDGLRISTEASEAISALADRNEFSFGYVRTPQLQSLQLFNTIETGIFRFTESLTAGTRGVNLSPYPLILNVGSFEDGLSNYEIVSNGTNARDGSLRNKAGEVLDLGDRSFLLMVTAADHGPAAGGDGNSKEPWVQFGIVELNPRLDTSSRHQTSTTAKE